MSLLRGGAVLIFILLAALSGKAIPDARGGGDARELSTLAPQHSLLKRDVGVWDATIQIAAGADGAMGVYNGTETNTLVAGGRWLLTDFKSRLEGEPFEGHAVFGYDREKKKYVRVWVDNTQTFFWPSEGEYDPSTDSLTLWMESTALEGEAARWRTVTVWKDADTRVFTMYVPGPESIEAAGMTIHYTRRKEDGRR